MYSVFRSISIAQTVTCPRYTLNCLYSTNIHAASRQKWRLSGVPAPRSILDDDDAPVDLSEDSEAVNGARPNTPPPHLRAPPTRPTPHEYRAHRKVIKQSFPEGWQPPRKLSREAMDGLRELYHLNKETFTTPMLAEKFRISPEAVRRILKSKWEPTKEQRTRLAEKNRKKKEEFIKLSRLRERIQVRELAQLNQGQPNGHGNIRPDESARGATSKDRLTFA